jgi:uncharacterized protein YndB with AHSA1/START domain
MINPGTPRRHAAMLTVSTPSDCEVLMLREFDAPPELVFRAWTEPALLSRWMTGPPGWAMPVCELDLREGGAWHFVWRHPDGREVSLHGQYLQIDAPQRLVASEICRADQPASTNTLILSDDGENTQALLKISYASKAARDAALNAGASDGMAARYEGLAALLAALQEQQHPEERPAPSRSRPSLPG